MIRSLVYLVIILAGLCLSPYLLKHTGYVYIAVGDYQIETSLVFSALVLILLFGAIQLVESFLTWLLNLLIGSRYLPKRWQHDSAKKQTLQGLLALAEQNWPLAETKMANSADKSELPLLNLLAAANAAQHQHKKVPRDEYLAKAETLPMAQQTVQIIRIRYQIEQGELDAAKTALSQLQFDSRSPSALLLLAVKFYHKQEDWETLANLLPLLKKKQVLSVAELDALEWDLHLASFAAAIEIGPKQLEQAWGELPRHLKKQASFLVLYTQGLAKFNQQALAVRLLLKRLKKHIEPQLVSVLAEVLQQEDEQAIVYLKGLEPTQEKCASYHQAMAQMNQRFREFKQAKFHWQKVCELAPSRNSWLALAELQQQLGENLSAMNSYRNAALALL